MAAGIAGDQTQAVAAQDLVAGARHGGVEENQAAPGRPSRERGDALRVARGETQGEARLRRGGEGEEALRPFDDLLHLIGRQHRDENDRARAADLEHGSGRAAAHLLEGAALGGIHVEADDLESGGEKPARQRRPHQADADQTDGFVITRSPR